MTNSTTSKFVAAVVGFSLALGVFGVVGASTAGAQAMTLSQLVDLFISLGIISSDKAAAAKAAVASSATASSYTFSTDLTVGSSGEAVTALQNAVGVSPATGYFGAVTKAAVQKYQAANGISATGYVGPLTRAALNKSVTTTTTTTTTGSTAVVNSGVEGTLTANKSSIPSSTVYEGDSMKSLLGIKLEAKLSEINVQRVKLSLGASTSFYTKVFKTIYLTDDSGKVIAQADLNSNTVVKDGGVYLLTLGGFNYTVPKDATKYLWVKADAYSSIDSTDRTDRTVTLPVNGVRGTDGAGVDQYSPATAFSQVVSINSSLTDSASLDLSLNSANFKSADVVADQGSAYNELDGVPVLSFDLRANRDNVEVTDLAIHVDATGSATINQVRLYDGSTLLQSETPNGETTTFTDIDNLVVAKDTVKTITVKVDVRSAATSSTTFTASASSTSFSAENTLGDSATVSGSATGENQYVRKIGPVFALQGISNGTVSKTTNQSGHATSTLPVTFTLNITAKGADLTFGAAGNQWALATTGQAVFYQNNVETASTTIMTSGSDVNVLYDVPSSGVTSLGNAFVLAKGSTITNFPVVVRITVGRTSGSASYAVGFSGFNWGINGAATTTSTFMSGKTEWRSSAVTLP